METIESILWYTPTRSLFDSESHEFKQTTMDQKLEKLATLNRHNLLGETIEKYKERYNVPNYYHVFNNLEFTLKYLLSQLKGIKDGQFSVYRDFTEEQLITALKEGLRNYKSNLL